MRAFFEGIESLFVDFLFKPLDFLRHLELSSWTAANIINWLFMAICFSALIYWLLQLRKFEDNNEENHDSTAHSFLH